MRTHDKSEKCGLIMYFYVNSVVLNEHSKLELLLSSFKYNLCYPIVILMLDDM